MSRTSGTHRLVTEPLAALPPLSPPFSAAAVEGAAAAGSMFWEAMCAEDSVGSGFAAAAAENESLSLVNHIHTASVRSKSRLLL